MKCQLYDAAGNRILWLDARDDDYKPEYGQLKNKGFELSQRFRLGQDLTAVLFGSRDAKLALFWNSDGSYEVMCGNAIRCLAHFTCEGSIPRNLVSVETPWASYISRKVDANYGCVVIPGRAVRVVTHEQNGDLFVDVGTPHRIRLVRQEWLDADVVDAMAYSNGPNPVNFNLVRRVAPFHYRVRTFERGVGETCSCGTAATSIVAALRDNAACLGASPPSHQVEFASGERLIVTYDASLESYEIGGRIALLQELSI